MEIKIASIEDSDEDFNSLMDNINEYSLKRNVSIQVERYKDGEEFLDKYHKQYDIIFMDILLVAQNGMKTAKQLREIDMNVTLFFITNSVQYAIEGYDVEALGYILKPIKFYSFVMQLDKAISHLNKDKDAIVIKNRNKVMSLIVSSIKYIEITNHDVYIYSLNGCSTFYGTLKLFEEATKEYHFARCSSSILVNLDFADSIVNDEVILKTGEHLHIGRSKKQAFIADFSFYKGSLA